MGWTSRQPSQKIVVGLAKPSSLFDENLQMVYLIHQFSFNESMVKYTKKVMNIVQTTFLPKDPPFVYQIQK